MYTKIVAPVRDMNKKLRSKTRTKQLRAHLASKQKEKSDSEMFNLEHAFVSFSLGKFRLMIGLRISASTEHMSEHRNYFTSFDPTSHKLNAKGVGRNNQPLEMKGKGDIKGDILYMKSKSLLVQMFTTGFFKMLSMFLASV